MPIHTLTIGKQPVKAKQFKHICQYLLSMAQEGAIPSIGNGYLNFQNIHLPGYPGITIRLNKSPFRRIELTLNPTRILGGTYADLYELTKTGLCEILLTVNALLLKIGANFSFQDMCLHRIDCTKDIVLPDAAAASNLIGCLKRSRLGRGYELEQFDHSYQNYTKKNRHSFRARCRDICLTVYDKSFQLEEECIMPPEQIPSNLLRVEAAFDNTSFQRILNEHLCCTTSDLILEKKILYFSNLSIKLLQKYFSIGVMPGRFLRLDVAKEEIENSRYSPAMKERLKQFMYQVRREYKYGVDGVIYSGNFSSGQISYLLDAFQKLNLNPAALPMISTVREIPGIPQLLDEDIAVIR